MFIQAHVALQNDRNLKYLPKIIVARIKLVRRPQWEDFTFQTYANINGTDFRKSNKDRRISEIRNQDQFYIFFLFTYNAVGGC